jgi:hypothetical protein
MIWIIISSVLTLYVFFTVCLLIIGSWADDWEIVLFADRFCYGNDHDVASSSSIPAMAESMFGTLVQS